MSVLIGAARIQDKHGTDYRLQHRSAWLARGRRHARQYRFALLNGWHCGHWHMTPEDALGCMVARCAPMQ